MSKNSKEKNNNNTPSMIPHHNYVQCHDYGILVAGRWIINTQKLLSLC